MPTFTVTVSADTLPSIEGEQLRATITNLTRGGGPQEFFGVPDEGSFDALYEGQYGDELSVVRDWTLGNMQGPDAEAVLVQLPFPTLPIPTGGGISVSLA